MVSSAKAKKESVPHASPIYKSLAPAYQAIWPVVAKKRIHDAVRTLSIPAGTSLLEVGVGTGMSLESYPTNIKVTGIDLSESMLAEAKQLIADRQWSHIHVMPMNAEKLDFEDSSFDIVTSFHTISVVSDPEAMMAEIARVTKPNGRILIVNHFRSENPLIARVVDTAGNFTKRLGWRTDLELKKIIGDFPVRVDEVYKPNPISLFTVIKATRHAK